MTNSEYQQKLNTYCTKYSDKEIVTLLTEAEEARKEEAMAKERKERNVLKKVADGVCTSYRVTKREAIPTNRREIQKVAIYAAGGFLLGSLLDAL